jgi:hypothetical protein
VRQAAFLQQQNVFHAHLRQMVGDRTTDGAAADDDDIRLLRKCPCHVVPLLLQIAFADNFTACKLLPQKTTRILVFPQAEYRAIMTMGDLGTGAVNGHKSSRCNQANSIVPGQ